MARVERTQRVGVVERIGMCWPAHERRQTSLDLAAAQQYTVLAFDAAQSDVRADTHNSPIATAAGVGFSEPDNVPDPKVDGHRCSYRAARAPRIASRIDSASRRAALCQSGPAEA